MCGSTVVYVHVGRSVVVHTSTLFRFRLVARRVAAAATRAPLMPTISQVLDYDDWATW